MAGRKWVLGAIVVLKELRVRVLVALRSASDKGAAR